MWFIMKNQDPNKCCHFILQLKVREHPLLGPFVEGLSSYVVKSFDDVNVSTNSLRNGIALL